MFYTALETLTLGWGLYTTGFEVQVMVSEPQDRPRLALPGLALEMLYISYAASKLSPLTQTLA